MVMMDTNMEQGVGECKYSSILMKGMDTTVMKYVMVKMGNRMRNHKVTMVCRTLWLKVDLR